MHHKSNRINRLTRVRKTLSLKSLVVSAVVSKLLGNDQTWQISCPAKDHLNGWRTKRRKVKEAQTLLPQTTVNTWQYIISYFWLVSKEGKFESIKALAEGKSTDIGHDWLWWKAANIKRFILRNGWRWNIIFEATIFASQRNLTHSIGVITLTHRFRRNVIFLFYTVNYEGLFQQSLRSHARRVFACQWRGSIGLLERKKGWKKLRCVSDFGWWSNDTALDQVMRDLIHIDPCRAACQWMV